MIDLWFAVGRLTLVCNVTKLKTNDKTSVKMCTIILKRNFIKINITTVKEF